MKFLISESVTEVIKNNFTATPAENRLGYDYSIKLQAPPALGGHVYTIYYSKRPRPLYMLEAHEAPTAGARCAFLCFADFEPGSIDLDHVTIYKGASNYGRRETSPRYLNKYNQLACIMYGAIAAGLLDNIPA